MSMQAKFLCINVCVCMYFPLSKWMSNVCTDHFGIPHEMTLFFTQTTLLELRHCQYSKIAPSFSTCRSLHTRVLLMLLSNPCAATTFHWYEILIQHFAKVRLMSKLAFQLYRHTSENHNCCTSHAMWFDLISHWTNACLCLLFIY